MLHAGDRLSDGVGAALVRPVVGHEDLEREGSILARR